MVSKHSSMAASAAKGVDWRLGALNLPMLHALCLLVINSRGLLRANGARFPPAGILSKTKKRRCVG